MSVRACVVCVCACVRLCVRACVCVCINSLIFPLAAEETGV